MVLNSGNLVIHRHPDYNKCYPVMTSASIALSLQKVVYMDQINKPTQSDTKTKKPGGSK
jgi:hypothetical protein